MIPRPGRASTLGFLVTLGLIGGGAAALAISENDSRDASTGEATLTTAATVSSEIEATGLTRLDPQQISARSTSGRVRIVPAGQPVGWDSAFEPEANLQAGEAPARSGRSGLAGVNGSEVRPTLPLGLAIEEAGSVQKRLGNEEILVSGAMRLSKVGQSRPVTLEYWRLKDGAIVEVTALAGSGVWDLGSASGAQGFLQSMSPHPEFEAVLNADFVIGDIYFRLRAPGTSAREVMALIAAFAEEMRK